MSPLTLRPLRRSDFPPLLRMSMELFSKHNEVGFPLTEPHMRKVLDSFLIRRDCYFKGMFLNGELVGWMLCVPGHTNHHSPVTGMSQLYYHSSLKGLLAARALVEFHEDFFKFVERHRYEIAVTSSSLPNCAVFSRLLERAGWTPTSSCRLVRLTAFHRDRSEERRAGPPGTRVLRGRGGPETAKGGAVPRSSDPLS